MRHTSATRVAIYARVSTADKQEPKNQTRQLAAWCEEQRHKIVKTYIDRESGAKADRPQFSDMMRAAGRREFDMVVCWSLDRFSREGIAATFQHLERLQQNGVKFYSYSEEYFRTIGPAGDLLIAVVAWVADFERRRRQERIKAGLDRAREAGVWTSRRPKHYSIAEMKEMKKMAQDGHSLAEIAKKFETSKATISRRLNNKLPRYEAWQAKRAERTA